jgi:lysyl-tRNA synthetase class 2
MTNPQDNLAFDQTRLDKVRALKEKGITIFPSSFNRQDTVSEIKTHYADITHERSAETVSTAGRIYIVRNHGKPLCDLGDETGKIQFVSEERHGESSSVCSASSSSGILSHHRIFTKLGEITIWVTFTLQGCMSLPEKFHAHGHEKRYRQRYVDLS